MVIILQSAVVTQSEHNFSPEAKRKISSEKNKKISLHHLIFRYISKVHEWISQKFNALGNVFKVLNFDTNFKF